MSFQSRFEGPWADPAAKMLDVKTGSWRYQRPVTRRGKCCQCGTCYFFCPTGSIESHGTYFSADLDYCKGCGICAKVCPINAIVMVREELGE